MRAIHYNIFMGTQHLGNLINGYLGWNHMKAAQDIGGRVLPDQMFANKSYPI